MSKQVEVNGGGCLGCVGFILGCIALWAIVFGVTIDGKHHEMSCSCKKGVELQSATKATSAPVAKPKPSSAPLPEWNPQ